MIILFYAGYWCSVYWVIIRVSEGNEAEPRKVIVSPLLFKYGARARLSSQHEVLLVPQVHGDPLGAAGDLQGLQAERAPGVAAVQLQPALLQSDQRGRLLLLVHHQAGPAPSPAGGHSVQRLCGQFQFSAGCLFLRIFKQIVYR